MKFFIDNIFLFCLAVLSGGALLIPLLQQRGNSLGVLQATQLINQNKTIIVDVRDAAQFAEGHIREAKNIPIKELAKRRDELDKFKNRKILVVCQNGTQSAKAAGILGKAGFGEVYGLSGGMAAWKKQSLPVVGVKADPVKGVA
ncbi:MAG: sulfurtransferase [Herbaspirillum sp.]|nr:sulfurtransferase [Herbaspirillum sp.]